MMRQGRKRKTRTHEENGSGVETNGTENGKAENGDTHGYADETKEKMDDSDGLAAMNIAHEDSTKPHD